MKTKILLFFVALCISCSAIRAQTSYGNLNQGNAGNSGGNTNSFFGYEAGLSNATGGANTFMGYLSGYFNTDGAANTFLGDRSGYNNTDGVSNIFIGYLSGYENTSGIYNTFIGTASAHENTTGSWNTFIGYQSGFYNNGDYNTFLGRNSGYHNQNGSDNTFLGPFSGYQNQNGSGNVFLGNRAGYNETSSNLLYIDNSDTPSPLIWGDFAANELRFNGSVRITGISQNNGLNRILVEDTDGDIHWRDAATLAGGTDDQQLSLVGDQLQLEDGGNVDLLPYLDNTDAQTLNFDAGINMLSVTNGNSVDLSSLAGGGGTPHDFPSYPDSAGDGGDNTNAYFGHESGLANATGIRNTFIGYQSGVLNNTGYENSALGALTLTNNTTGAQNTANGIYTLNANSSGNYNSAIGYGALGFNTEGHRNTAIGYSALAANLTGSNNTAVGNNAGTNGVNYSNTTALGNGAIATASNMVRIGDAAVTVIEGQVPYSFPSDGRFKSNISEKEVKGLDFIKRLRPVVYNFDTRKYQEFSTKNMSADMRKKYLDKDFTASAAIRQSGFIAQEVVQAALESKYNFNGVHIPKDENDNYSLAYSQFVVPLTKAVQELSAIVESQKQENEELLKRIEALENIMESTKEKPQFQENSMQSKSDEFMLLQNIPNPFDKTTTISALIPETVQKAKIVIYNLQGLELKSYDIKERGNTSLDISVRHFPAGIYLYGLIADGQIIDTKKMILRK